MYRHNPDPAYAEEQARLERLSAEGLWQTNRAAIAAVYDRVYGEDQLNYFRDSYNDSSLFWRLGLSWWQDLDAYLGPNGDGVMVQEEEGGRLYDCRDLYPAGATRLRAECARRGELMLANLRDEPDETKAYFDRKLRRFLAFLDAAITAGDPISCSC